MHMDQYLRRPQPHIGSLFQAEILQVVPFPGLSHTGIITVHLIPRPVSCFLLAGHLVSY